MEKDVNYEVTEQTEVKATIKVEIPAALVEKRLTQIYRKYNNKVSIPGFRPGKIPVPVLNTHFGSELFQKEAHDELVKDHLPQALSEHLFQPVMPPDVEHVQADIDKPFIFTASFEVLPDFDLPSYKGIEIEASSPAEPTDKEIDDALEHIRLRHGVFTPKEESAVEPEDIVRVTDSSGIKWEGAVKTEGKYAALIGSKVGDKVLITLDRPDKGEDETEVEIINAWKLDLPELGDDLALTAGYADLITMRSEIEKKLRNARQTEHTQKLKLSLLDKIITQIDIPLPETFVKQAVEKDMQRHKSEVERVDPSRSFTQYLEEQGKSEEVLQAEISAATAQQIRSELVINKIVAAEKIELDEAEIERLAEEEAERAGENTLRFLANLKANDQLENFRRIKTRERVLNLIYEHAVIKD
ncbi:trigger factor [Candidatus Bipolaricaulota bacterium]|nr:trigger factor [Candidatus Bipolaricaulota bacterium]